MSFGMKRETVRAIMGEYRVFPKDPYADNSSDSFSEGKFNCYYDKEDRLYGVIVSNEFEVKLEDKVILPISEKKFAAMFEDAVLNYDGEEMTWVKSVGLTAYNYDGKVSFLTIGTNEFYRGV